MKRNVPLKPAGEKILREAIDMMSDEAVYRRYLCGEDKAAVPSA